jgi:hypothetical protein
MLTNAHIQTDGVEHFCEGRNETIDASYDRAQLVQENGCLRAIVTELLIKNQNLRWALLGEGSPTLSPMLTRTPLGMA